MKRREYKYFKRQIKAGMKSGTIVAPTCNKFIAMGDSMIQYSICQENPTLDIRISYKFDTYYINNRKGTVWSRDKEWYMHVFNPDNVITTRNPYGTYSGKHVKKLYKLMEVYYNKSLEKSH